MTANRGRRAHLRKLVDLGDSAAAALLAGLPYSDQDPEGIGGHGRVRIDWSRTDPVGLVSSRGGAPGQLLTVDSLALNRAGSPCLPRPMPPPADVARLVSLGRQRNGHRVTRTKPSGVAGITPESIDVGPSVAAAHSSVFHSLVERLSKYRVALLDPEALGGDLALTRLAVQLIASGILCAIPKSIRPQWLGARLRDALDIDFEAVLGDDLEWAAALARQVRAAWLTHDLWLRWGDDGPRLAPVPLPHVSVILVSRRPHLVPAAVQRIAAQQTVRPEIVVALHTSAPRAKGDVESSLVDAGLPHQLLTVDDEVPFGAVLNRAVERASGSLVTKWDDDDLYGQSHLEDLIVALRRSKADMVGKGAEFVHFEKSGETIVRNMNGAEADSLFIAGATLTTSRDLLLGTGGFPPLPTGVDHHLKIRYRAQGLRVFRTHGFGFVATRRGDGHTWQVDEGTISSQAIRRWKGIPPVSGVTG